MNTEPYKRKILTHRYLHKTVSKIIYSHNRKLNEKKKLENRRKISTININNNIMNNINISNRGIIG